MLEITLKMNVYIVHEHNGQTISDRIFIINFIETILKWFFGVNKYVCESLSQ